MRAAISRSVAERLFTNRWNRPVDGFLSFRMDRIRSSPTSGGFCGDDDRQRPERRGPDSVRTFFGDIDLKSAIGGRRRRSTALALAMTLAVAAVITGAERRARIAGVVSELCGIEVLGGQPHVLERDDA
jgi:hypothetical protein